MMITEVNHEGSCNLQHVTASDDEQEGAVVHKEHNPRVLCVFVQLNSQMLLLQADWGMLVHVFLSSC
jgi:hypothetical protein